MSKVKEKKLLEVDRWSVGVDPAFQGTAAVLMADNDPLAAESARATGTKHPAERTRSLAMWLQELLQGWIDTYEITELHVVIEKAFLNDQNRAVTTLASQMRMFGVYQHMLYDLERCEVHFGEVVNSTVKKVFAGHGGATKIQMVSRSVWSHRKDLDIDYIRNHLADAQGIGTCYPKMILVKPLTLAKIPYYQDHNIGKGSAWKGKYKRKL